MSSITGECACGKIKVEVPRPTESDLCHCTDCRKSGGGPAGWAFGVPRDAVHLSGATPKKFASTGSTGMPVQRYFCGDCGSPIWIDVDVVKDKSWVRGGLFPPGLIPKPGHHLFGKNFEEWEKPIEGARVFDEQPEE